MRKLGGRNGGGKGGQEGRTCVGARGSFMLMCHIGLSTAQLSPAQLVQQAPSAQPCAICLSVCTKLRAKQAPGLPCSGHTCCLLCSCHVWCLLCSCHACCLLCSRHTCCLLCTCHTCCLLCSCAHVTLAASCAHVTPAAYHAHVLMSHLLLAHYLCTRAAPWCSSCPSCGQLLPPGKQQRAVSASTLCCTHTHPTRLQVPPFREPAAAPWPSRAPPCEAARSGCQPGLHQQGGAARGGRAHRRQ